MLCHPIQRYKFESNSQQVRAYKRPVAGCVTRYKDTNLKAIHCLKLWHIGVVIFYQPEST